MATVDLKQIEAQNTDAYDDLIVSVSASTGVLSLFLAVCDDAVFREEIIQRYEMELAAARIVPCRGQLEPLEPSLRQAVAAALEQEPQLQNGGRGVITVLGADALLPLVLGEASRSQQDEFLGYLQWTREAMRSFKQPIVLWVTSRLLREVGRKAPDFWSWRKDVFRFQAPSRSELLQPKGLELLPQFEAPTEDDDDELPIEELLKLVEEREQQENAQDDPLLATLYFRLGVAYKNQSDSTGGATYKGSIEQAITWLNKARLLQDFQKRNNLALANTWSLLAQLYGSKGDHEKAESLFKKALLIRQKELGEKDPLVATTLNNLAEIYYEQKEYEQAEILLQLSFEIIEESLGTNRPELMILLGNLAALYTLQQKYEQAELIFTKILELEKRYFGNENPKTIMTLINLSGVYYKQKKYQQAEPLLLESLRISKQNCSESHHLIGVSSTNLATLYQAMGNYRKAEHLYFEGLKVMTQCFGEKHPRTEETWEHFVGCILMAEEAGLAHTLSDHPLTQSLLQQIRENPPQT